MLPPRPHPGRSEVVSGRACVESQHSPVSPDKLAIVKLLRNKQYADLDRLLDDRTEQFRRDFKSEYLLFDAFQSFRLSDTSIEPTLDEWIRTNPRSANARLARATFYCEMGWKTRGTDSIDNTSGQQIRGMREYFRAAAKDIQDALAIRPDDFIAVSMLQEITRASGDTESSAKYQETLLKISPYSFIVRSGHILNLVPRWGGSYADMQRVADEAQQHVGVNPKLRVLQGYIPWDKGYIAELDGDNQEALAQYTKAISFGEHWQFLQERGVLYYRLKQYDKALADLNRADELRPQMTEVLEFRGNTLWAMGNRAGRSEKCRLLHRALADWNTTVALDPGNREFREARQRLQAHFDKVCKP